MSRTHTVASGTIQPSTTYKSFDLNEFVNELPSAWLRAQIARSYAWRIDTMLVQACRTLFKLVRDEAMTGGLDDASDYNLALAEQAFAEECFGEAGSSTAGPVQTVHELLDLRHEAHAMASEATRQVLDWKGHLQSYDIPEISDLFKNQGTMKPKATTLARIDRMCKRRAAAVATGKDAEILAGRLAAKKIERENMKSASISRALKAQTGALEMMFNIASANRPKKMLDRTLHFHQIDIETQRTLVAACMQSLQLAEERALSDSVLSDSEFDDVSLGIELATEELRKVLKSPRFNNGVDGNTTTGDKVLSARPTATNPKVKVDTKPLPKPKAAPKPKKVKVQVKVEPKPIAAPAPVQAPAVASVNSLSELKSLVDQANDLA